jgi:quercetin dioxygenase-like cupin family protein
MTISARKTMALATISVLTLSVWSMMSAVSQTRSTEPVIEISSAGSRTASPGAPSNFTGHVEVQQLFPARSSSRLSGGVVVFQPGAHSAWHTHPLGQVLVVTAGTGLVQQWGGPILTMKTGDVVWIPAGVKHWHGASPTSGVTQMAIQEVVDGKNLEWLEPVTEQQYSGASQKDRR